MQVGIGLHISQCLCGFMGTGERAFFLVASDGVNFAHRLAHMSRETHVTVSESVRTRATAGDFRELTPVLVKGKPGPTRLFELHLP